MKEELDEKLVEKYPKIFQNRFERMQKTAMCWGFECGDGWYDLIDTLCECIQNHIDNCYRMGNADIEQVVAVQVKEKFGGLRFYVDGGDEHTMAMIEFAESFSHNICAVCGNKGKTRGVGWITTLCDEHAKD
jgi:hypothetical protein